MTIRAALLLLLFGPAMSLAQRPVRAGLVDAPAVGKTAPALTAQYATASGPGPEDQPFRLGAELGRVVVIFFGPPEDTARWRAIAALADSAFAGQVVVGVTRTGFSQVVDLAAGLPSAAPKLLADSAGQSHRAFGARQREWTVVVVDDAGRIAHRGPGDPRTPGLIETLGGVVRRSRSIP